MEETTGIEPIARVGKEIKIAGKKHTLRRLRVRDSFKLGRIIAVAAGSLGADLDKANLDSAGLMNLLVAGFPFAEELTISFMADMLGVEKEAFDDPDVFPMGSELKILNEICTSPDAMAFFEQCRTIIMPMIEAAAKKKNETKSENSLTASSIDTDGKTE